MAGAKKKKKKGKVVAKDLRGMEAGEMRETLASLVNDKIAAKKKAPRRRRK
jgi:hypothetical protein